MEFKNRIRELRKKNGLTQVELAEKIGVSARCVQNYELGARLPRYSVLDKLCAVLGVSGDYLLGSGDMVVDAPRESSEKALPGLVSAEEFLQSANALFAGGEMSEEDKEKVMLALQKIYIESKEMLENKLSEESDGNEE